MSIENLVFVGTYTEQILFGNGQVLNGKGKGIYSFRFDPATGKLTEHGLTENVRNPSYLCFDEKRQFLYSANELREFEGQFGGAISAFRINQNTGSLTFLNSKPTKGTDPCHIAVDKTGRFVFAANFSSGSVVGYRINDDGSLGAETVFVQHHGSSINSRRQTGPHAHAVTFDGQGRFAYVPDLGLDKIMIYELDLEQGRLKPSTPPSFAVSPGAGPRQFVMHPSGGYAYGINELDCTISTYGYDSSTGTLKSLQTVSTLPAGFSGTSTCAHMQITPDGRFLYGSNRGHNSLVIYAVDPVKATLTLVGHESARGAIPRNFEISPSGRFLVVANQDTDNLVPFAVDPASGKLAAVDQINACPTPICVRFI